ncbi:hypothetical protein STEG23_036246 [Scotinomys teguina]
MRRPAKVQTQQSTDVLTQQPAAEAPPFIMRSSRAAAGRHQAGITRCFKQAHAAAAHRGQFLPSLVGLVSAEYTHVSCSHLRAILYKPFSITCSSSGMAIANTQR